jgi:nitrile hydratase
MRDEPTITKLDLVKAEGEDPAFTAGVRVVISMRFPVGHYRVPHYIRGKSGEVRTRGE